MCPRIREVSLKLKLRNSIFGVEEGYNPVHASFGEGLKTDPSKVSQAMSSSAPYPKKDLPYFLTFFNFKRRFVQIFAYVAVPLHTLITVDSVRFERSQEDENSFKIQNY